MFHVTKPRAKILLIDDDKLSGKVAGFHFEELHCQATHVLTAHEALELLKTEQFDIILLDLELPDKTGFETAALIRQNEEGQFLVPIVGLTAHHDPRYKEMAVEAGMNDLYVKPFTEHCAQQLVERFAKSQFDLDGSL
jgi:CheY-like chemotaxis protein